jgi:gliding motility-associated lipoprotein GldH
MYYNPVTSKLLKIFFLALITSICLASCSKMELFEKSAPIPEQKWFTTYSPSFSFNITDTASLYNIYIVIRHTDAYKFNNIWLKLDMQFPEDSVRSRKLDITLGTDANGWEGAGMDDIFEYRKIISPGPVPFKKTGKYTFTISQIMREDPLEHILNVGIRAEKVKL